MIQSDKTQEFDVIVMGAGPAGTTAAALLAEQGRNVALLERQTFPRYCVGESLLPYCYYTLDRLGLIDRMNASHFTVKHSVQFVSTSGKRSKPFYFFQHSDHPAMKTWQVSRSEFDSMLLDNAVRRGATLIQPCEVKSLVIEDGVVVGVTAADARSRVTEYRAPMTIDCTGREALSIKQLGWRIKDSQLNKFAVWTYYKGAVRDEGHDEGATTVAYLPDKGWFWHIPLPDGVSSVGVVAERDYLFRDSKDPSVIIDREIKNNPWMVKHLSPATQHGEYHVTSDFSYRSKYCAMEGLVLAGDAFAFLDPVFSSGVFLALRSGEMAADVVNAAFEADDFGSERFAGYGAELCDGIEAMRKLVYVFYDETFRFGDVLKKHPNLRHDLTDVLIGNLFRDYDELYGAIAQFARLPAPLEHGRPQVHAK